MSLNFACNRLGLCHAPAVGIQGLDTALPPSAFASATPHAIDWHTAMGLDLHAPDPLGNDTHGDCVEAGFLRLAQLRMANAWGSHWKPTAAQALALYAKWAGYDPTTGANDGGTAVATAQTDAWAQGLDLGLQAPDVCIPVVLDHTNQDHLKRAAWLLGGIGLCLDLPIEWQTAAIWTAGSGTPGSWGGHFVISGEYTSNLWTCITWGIEQPITWTGIQQYCVAAIAMVSRTWLSASGLTPVTLDWNALYAQATALGQLGAVDGG